MVYAHTNHKEISSIVDDLFVQQSFSYVAAGLPGLTSTKLVG